MISRRSFFRASAGMAAASSLGFLVPPVTAAEAKVDPKTVRFHPDIEPLVRFLEETPRERVLEEVAARIRGGTSYREIVAALMLAGVRNIQPRPVGFKFHAVLVVNSAHQAALASPDSDRWLPILWAIDQFKSSQARDIQEGDWTMAPVDEGAVPPSHKARQAFIDAMDNWDEPAADAAIVGLARTAGAREIFELLARYGVRDFREIGHKEIYVANSFRTLEVIGWQHAEPVLRSLTYAILDRLRDPNPAKSDLPADRPFRRNLELASEIKPGWLDGKPNADATLELIRLSRDASAVDMSRKTVELLNSGVAPSSIYDALFDACGELLMRAPGILSLHATTFTNAAHYAFQHTRDEQIRKMLLLQNAAFIPLFRGNSKDKELYLDKLEPLAAKEGVEEIFADISKDRLTASRKILGWLRDNPDPEPFAAAARRKIFEKGRDSHDYKFSSAILEDYSYMRPPWRDRYLAASAFYLRGSGDTDTDLLKRIRSALG